MTPRLTKPSGMSNWLACRYHVGEVLISRLWKDLKVEKSQGPHPSMFNKLKQHWEKFILLEGLQCNLRLFSDTIPLGLVELYQQLLHNDYQRHDIKELIELCLTYIRAGEVDLVFRKPGAMHNARLMAKIIYSLKIFMIRDFAEEKLPDLKICTFEEYTLITRFVNFCVLVYVPWWLTASNGADSVINDFLLVKKVSDYALVDKDCSDSATNSLKNQLWYLSAELIPLGWFCDKINDATKEKVAKEILLKRDEVSKIVLTFIS